ncbi:uncharacterized protein BP5553_06688 [Venustampulla echinocandica]|uniref:AB hydrolase-1 domain-containing protein n=1 Tax=Venustampulla echinocandica TaxID=2656787 RepID=A0A370TKM0_9HELO|nr:uncharacterized protein BP5553_06688 [Venustampulla echinocandica]RDL36076.1 hypothetical protein BP5553_06688 [Venustampulla echinocandica]
MANRKDSASKPVIVIVPGSFSPASLYQNIIDELQAAGYEATTIDLPTVGDSKKASGVTLNDDAVAIQGVLAEFADEGKDIILVTHSYGGIAGAEGAKGFAKKDREAGGKKGGIVRMVYVTALVAQVGQSLTDVMAPYAPSQLQVKDGHMTLDPLPNTRACFPELSETEGLKWTARMPGHSATSFTDKATYPAYKFIPMSYMLCETDLVIPPKYQRSMVEMVEKESGRPVDVHSYAIGHAPNVTMPEAMVETIRRAAGEVL